MAVSITVAPSSPTHAASFARVTVAGATIADTTTFSTSQYPTETPFRYYLTFEKSGVQGKSYEFELDSAGGHVFNNYMFPTAGSWTVRLSKHDGTSVATQAVTVS